MAFDFGVKIRKMIESWLLSDNLGSSNYTDANIANKNFMQSFGIEEMCLIEMYDSEKGVYFTPSVMGKFLVFNKTVINGGFLEKLTSLIKDKMPKGYSVQISTYGYKDTIDGHKFLLSMSCNGDIEKEEQIDKLVEDFKIIEDHVKEIADELISVNPSYLLDYLNKIFYAEEQFSSIACPYYLPNKLIREQLIDSSEKVKVSCSRDKIDQTNLKTNKSYSMSVLGVQQYPILQDEKTLETSFYDDVLSDNSITSEVDIALISVGIHKPDEEIGSNATVAEVMKNKIGVYSFICCFTENDPKENIIEHTEAVKEHLACIDYKYSIVKNRQLGALSMLIPLQLDNQAIDQVERMKVLHRVNEISRPDLLPLLLCLGHQKESE